MRKLKKIKLAVLIGKGGRLPAIYRCVKKDPLVDLVLVLSHKKQSPGIDLAKKWGIESFYFRLSDFKKKKKSREDYERSLTKILLKRKIDLVVLAGWDLMLGREFLKHFKGKSMNIHPSLCPAFPGMEAERQALDYGVRYTGCTLHFVDEGVDTGPIILQKVVKVDPKDNLESLQKKIHPLEEKILCQGIRLFARGKLKIKGRKVIIK
jgi:phosphoribosylglycinamide formyltransferase-1